MLTCALIQQPGNHQRQRDRRGRRQRSWSRLFPEENNPIVLTASQVVQAGGTSWLFTGSGMAPTNVPPSGDDSIGMRSICWNLVPRPIARKTATNFRDLESISTVSSLACGQRQRRLHSSGKALHPTEVRRPDRTSARHRSRRTRMRQQRLRLLRLGDQRAAVPVGRGDEASRHVVAEKRDRRGVAAVAQR